MKSLSSKKRKRKELLKIGSSKGKKKINFGKKVKKRKAAEKLVILDFFNLFFIVKRVPPK